MLYFLTLASSLIINEIMYAPSPAELEFVELLNQSSEIVDLCTLTFSDAREVPSSICDGNHMLLPGDYVVLVRDFELFNQAYPGLTDLTITPNDWPALNNSGDAVIIAGPAGIIDAVHYESSWGRAGYSLERIDPAGPAQASFNWAPSTDPHRATPGAQNSVFAPDTEAPQLWLAERTTPNTLTLFWNEPVDLAQADHFSFHVSSNQPVAIRWPSPTETELDFGDPVLDDLLTFEYVADLTGNQHDQTSHPIAFTPEPGQLKINELMFEPLADPFDGWPDQPEYIELVNVSKRSLSLRHIGLTGPTDEFGDADTLRTHTDFPVADPGAYMVYFASAATTIDQPAGLLLAAFPESNSKNSDALLLPIARSSLGLLNAGDFVGITNHIGMTIDDVHYYQDWHHPLLASTRGIALERRALMASSNFSDNWDSSIAIDGGTPGYPNSIVPNAQSAKNASGLSIEPNIFSPDGDGIDDALAIRLNFDGNAPLIDIKIFDLDGRQVRTLVTNHFTGSEEIFFWDGYGDDGQLRSTGIYIVMLELLDARAGKTARYKTPAVLALPHE